MTWITSYNSGTSTVNIGPTSSTEEVLFLFKEILCNHDGASGQWSVVMSADGLSEYSATEDILTSYSSGTKGFGNGNAWYVLEDPSGAQYLIGKSTFGQYFYYWYCKAGDFSGGSATTRPTGTGVVGMNESGLSHSALFGIVSGSHYMHMAVSDTAINGAWPFWLITRVSGTGASGNALFVDCVSAASSPSDADPRIMLVKAGALKGGTGLYLANSSSQCCSFGYMKPGLSGEEWARLFYVISTSYLALGANPVDGKYLIHACPIARAASQGSTLGVKGIATVLYPTLATLAYGSLVKVGSDYYFCVDDFMLPGWPGNTITPLI